MTHTMKRIAPGFYETSNGWTIERMGNDGWTARRTDDGAGLGASWYPRLRDAKEACLADADATDHFKNLDDAQATQVRAMLASGWQWQEGVEVLEDDGHYYAHVEQERSYDDEDGTYWVGVAVQPGGTLSDECDL